MSCDSEMALEAARAILSITPVPFLQDHTLIVRALGAAYLLPAIIQRLSETGIGYSDIRLRNNSLEDVFVALTGRKLRE